MIPSCEQILSAWLRDQSTITSIVGDHVYTTTPNEPKEKMPMIRLTRIGGEPPMSRPLHIDRATIQVDCFGGSKYTSETLAHTARGLICDSFPGTRDDAVICNVMPRGLSYSPDETYSPPVPRYMFDVEITLHPVIA